MFSLQNQRTRRQNRFIPEMSGGGGEEEVAQTMYTRKKM
jgi:hypothetical protein